MKPQCGAIDWRGALCHPKFGLIAPNAWCTLPRGHAGPWHSQDGDRRRSCVVVASDAEDHVHMIPLRSSQVFLPTPSPSLDVDAYTAAVARSDAIAASALTN